MLLIGRNLLFPLSRVSPSILGRYSFSSTPIKEPSYCIKLLQDTLEKKIYRHSYVTIGVLGVVSWIVNPYLPFLVCGSMLIKNWIADSFIRNNLRNVTAIQSLSLDNPNYEEIKAGIIFLIEKQILYPDEYRTLISSYEKELKMRK